MKQEEFIKELTKIGINLDETMINQFNKYALFLSEYNKTTNLTSIKNIEDIYLKHFYDSLMILKHIKFSDEMVLDIGSGPGFPGVPLKIVCPNIKLTVLDSNGKKTKFLEELKKELDIDYTVVHDRAENYINDNREHFDIVVSRAVSRLSVLAELSLPFVKVGGIFISYKGNVSEEMEEAKDAIDILSNGNIKLIDDLLPVENATRTFVEITKNCKTDIKYPRPYDRITKKTLQKNRN